MTSGMSTRVIFRQMKEEFASNKVVDPSRFAMYRPYGAAITPRGRTASGSRDGCEQAWPVYERKGIGISRGERLCDPGLCRAFRDISLKLGTYCTLPVGAATHCLRLLSGITSDPVPHYCTVKPDRHDAPGSCADVFTYCCGSSALGLPFKVELGAR